MHSGNTVWWFRNPAAALSELLEVQVWEIQKEPWIILFDGSEIRDSPGEVVSLSHYLQGFSTIPGGCLGFLNHQQWWVHKQFPNSWNIAIWKCHLRNDLHDSMTWKKYIGDAMKCFKEIEEQKTEHEMVLLSGFLEVEEVFFLQDALLESPF